MIELTLEERHHIRSRISTALCNLDEFHAFFSPSLRRFFARCVTRSPAEAFGSVRGAAALPMDAVFIGTYSHGSVRARDVVEDLEDVIAAV